MAIDIGRTPAAAQTQRIAADPRFQQAFDAARERLAQASQRMTEAKDSLRSAQRGVRSL